MVGKINNGNCMVEGRFINTQQNYPFLNEYHAFLVYWCNEL